MVLIKWSPYADLDWTQSALTGQQKSVYICKISWLEETETKVNKQKFLYPASHDQNSLLGLLDFCTSQASKGKPSSEIAKWPRRSKLEYEESMWSSRHLRKFDSLHNRYKKKYNKQFTLKQYMIIYALRESTADRIFLKQVLCSNVTWWRVSNRQSVASQRTGSRALRNVKRGLAREMRGLCWGWTPL